MTPPGVGPYTASHSRSASTPAGTTPLQVAPLSKLRPTKIVVAARSSSQTAPDLSTATCESNPAVALALKTGCEYSNEVPPFSERQKSMPPGMPPTTAGPPTGAEMYTLLFRLSTAIEGSPSPRVGMCCVANPHPAGDAGSCASLILSVYATARLGSGTHGPAVATPVPSRRTCRRYWRSCGCAMARRCVATLLADERRM